MKLDNYHYHEALDRTYVVGNIIDEILIDHPVIHKHKRLRNKLEKASSLIGEVYQEIGSISARLCEGEK
jgi:hypothetical protein